MDSSREKLSSFKKHPVHKKTHHNIWAYAAAAVLVVSLAIPIISSQQQQETRSRAAAAIATGTVPAQTGGKIGSATVKGLTTGTTYKVVVSGTYYYRKGVKNYNDLLADAQWSDKDEQKAKTGSYDVRQQKPRFNGVGLNAQDLTASVSANHTYTYIWKATSDTLTLTMPDSKYPDNVGGLKYAIYLDSASTSPNASASASLSQGASETVGSPSVSVAQPSVVSPTWQCITSNGVMTCSGASLAPSDTASSPAITNGVTEVVSPSVTGEEASVSPSTSKAPCGSTQSVTQANNGHTNEGLFKRIWEQIKKYLNIKDEESDTPTDSETAPCPSISPTT